MKNVTDGPEVTLILETVLCLSISLNRGHALWEATITALEGLTQSLLKSVKIFHLGQRSLDETQRRQALYEKRRGES